MSVSLSPLSFFSLPFLRGENVGLAGLAVLLGLGAGAAEAGGHHVRVRRLAPGRGGSNQFSQAAPRRQRQGEQSQNKVA